MKKVISLVIAIAVMVSLFIVPVSAAEQVIDLSTLDTYNFPAAGINDVVGFHFATGGQSGDYSLGTLDLSGYNMMVVTYRNGVQPGDSVADIELLNGANEQVGILETEGSGGWSSEIIGYIDISAVTSTSDTYSFKLLSGPNGSWITGVKLTTDTGVSSVITTASAIKAGETKLTQDIKGTLIASSGTYVIDLAGCTWSNTSGLALNVNGADVTIIDSVGGGKIIVTQNDAIEVNSGKLTAKGVTIVSDNSGGDALFVNGGTTVVEDCTLYAKKAGIDVSQNGNSATITVKGGTFAGTYSAAEDRTCAIEFRNNDKTLTLSGDITFTNDLILRRNECTKALTEVITAGTNSEITYGEDASVAGYDNYIANTISYTYTGSTEPDGPADPSDPADPSEPSDPADPSEPGTPDKDVEIDINALPDASEFKAAGYEDKVLIVSKELSLGTHNLKGCKKIVLSYGADKSAPLGDHDVYIKDASGNVIGKARLTASSSNWASSSQDVVIEIDSDYNGEIFVAKDEFGHQIAVSAAKLVYTAGSDVPTGDVLPFVILIAAAALVVTILSKKRAF
ncbi:MAG: hypothetical protein IKJ59_10410 [Clostridia bacterium]|nr:hypothetical protein [Clostridia bacterium]